MNDTNNTHETIRPLFELGQTVATPGALQALAQAHGDQARRETLALLGRHVSGDWGDLCQEDKEANDQALRHGTRLFSAYELPQQEGRVWIITEADRSTTTILLPADY